MTKQTKQNDKKVVKHIDLVREKGKIVVCDTETVGKAQVRNSVLPFDIGIVVYNVLKGIMEKCISFINKNLFRDKEERATIYYQNTLPKYDKELKNNKEEFFEMSAYHCLVEINKLWKAHKIKYWCAYNSDFDSNAIANLYKKFPRLTNPFSQDREIDILTCVLQAFIDFPELLKQYRLFCHATNKYSDSLKNYSISAETIGQFFFSYLLKEDHMGLSDAKLECLILEYLIELYRENKIPFVVELGKRWQSMRYDIYVRRQMFKPYTTSEYLNEIIDFEPINQRNKNYGGNMVELRNEKARLLLGI